MPCPPCLVSNLFCLVSWFTYDLSGDDVVLLVLVETRDALDTHVVGFRCARSEDDLLWISTNQLGHFLSWTSEERASVHLD